MNEHQHSNFHYASPKPPPHRQRIHIASRIVLGLLLLIAIGTGLLLLPGVGANGRLSVTDALFTAVSALTVTGLSTISAGRDLTLFGQIILLVLIQVGGVGYMFMASAALRIIGRRVSLMDRLALSNSLGLDTPAAILIVLKRTFYGILAIEAGGTLLLWLHWGLAGTVENGRLFFYALFHAISAFCNAGFDLFGGLPQYPEGIPNNTGSLLILGSLIFLGALGFPVLAELFTWNWRKRLSLHSRMTLTVVVSLLLIGWITIWIPEATKGVLADLPLGQQLIRSFFQAISNRTAGFAGLPNFSQMTDASQMMIMMQMFVGSAPASMGGGLTTGTFAVLLLTLWGYARGHNQAQISGRRIAESTVRRAGAVLTVGILVLTFATWGLLATHDLPLNVVLFEVVSAFATCGLSLGVTGEFNFFGQIILMLVMIWGRLGALTIIIAVAQQGRNIQLIKYPEETVLIG
ncbi:MAG: potassium transporter TrkG [Chloroflexota bacterium]